MISFNFDNYETDIMNESEMILDIHMENVAMMSKLSDLGDEYINEVKAYTVKGKSIKYLFTSFMKKDRTLKEIDKDIERCDKLIEKLDAEMEKYKNYSKSQKVAYNLGNLLYRSWIVPVQHYTRLADAKRILNNRHETTTLKQEGKVDSIWEYYKQDLILAKVQTQKAKEYLKALKVKMEKEGK